MRKDPKKARADIAQTNVFLWRGQLDSAILNFSSNISGMVIAF